MLRGWKSSFSVSFSGSWPGEDVTTSWDEMQLKGEAELFRTPQWTQML